MKPYLTMPFGKFRGMPLSALPFLYLLWLLENVDLREPLKSAIAAEYERRIFSQENPGHVNAKVANEIISAGVRILATKHHPDHGGSTDRMTAINLAGEWLREQARQQLPERPAE